MENCVLSTASAPHKKAALAYILYERVYCSRRFAEKGSASGLLCPSGLLLPLTDNGPNWLNQLNERDGFATNRHE